MAEQIPFAIQAIHSAASTWGFFLLTGTEVSPSIQTSLLSTSQAFFDLPLEVKASLNIRNRGHTHGHVDWKEGLYVGPEHSKDHPLVSLPLHSKSQFPDQVLPSMRHEVLEYIGEVTKLGKTLTDVFSLGLGLREDELRGCLLEPEPVDSKEGFGIGEHTDFGYLTILKVDSPGLQILSPSNQWVDVPLVKNSFVVNSDMFDQLTHGHYQSRPHRVRQPTPGSPPRFSFPLFFDFAWNAEIKRLPMDHLPPLSNEEKQLAKLRWAATTFREVQGSWSQYLARKVQRVFPNLGLPDFEPNAAPSTRFTRVVECSL
ncbi:Clavaminate synthase-like protein [Amniculicola lignicola CBS 123094]|uniref:Clavaminate synthase-like protein n=1 Tax=Amniculicola lignicola CBS 123094 TaxID=1392246 RepID=A0A6A5VWB2_9PLEO|nr:Clavaminate synthase-like protein [Amniculicola lignicola CBS 123094]